MSEWTTELGALLAAANKPWYETDASWVWDTLQDTDTLAVDPIIGASLPKTGTQAVYSAGLWDMQSSNYANALALPATISLDVPFLWVKVVDKNNHVGSSNTLDYVGTLGTDSVAFGSSSSVQPRFVVAVNAVSTQMLTQSAWSAKGTVLAHWVYFNRTDPTNTIQSGFNATTTTQSGVVALASGRSLARNMTKGNAAAQTKEGYEEIVSRAGMTFSDAMAIVAKVRARAGI